MMDRPRVLRVSPQLAVRYDESWLNDEAESERQIILCPQYSRKVRTNSFSTPSDPEEPPHVHVEREACTAKFWLDPVRLESNSGFGRVEIRRIQKLVEENSALLLRGWNEFFERASS